MASKDTEGLESSSRKSPSEVCNTTTRSSDPCLPEDRESGDGHARNMDTEKMIGLDSLLSRSLFLDGAVTTTSFSPSLLESNESGRGQSTYMDTMRVEMTQARQQTTSPAEGSRAKSQASATKRVPKKKGSAARKSELRTASFANADEGIVTASDCSSNSHVSIMAAQPFDILLGRGKKHRQHPGNVRMHQIVNTYREIYLKTTARREKAALVGQIVDFMKSKSGEKNGRFLRLEPSKRSWVEISDEDAHRKVGHALRDTPRNSGMERLSIDSGNSGRDESQASASSDSILDSTAQQGNDDDAKMGVAERAVVHALGHTDEDIEPIQENHGDASQTHTSDWLPKGWFD